MKKILVSTTNPDALHIIRDCLQSDYQIESTSIREGCIELFQKTRYDFLFIDVEMVRQGAVESDYKVLLQPFWKAFPDLDIIVLSPQEMIREAVNAVKAGASDYLTYPIDPSEVKYVIDNIEKNAILTSELNYFRSAFWHSDSFAILQSNSGAMRQVFDKVRAVAETESTVLLTGETGTGKGVFAKLIHQHSKRSEHQFISVHCGAIPDTLLESELFGHEKGAFTGAVRRKLGKFEIAQSGTIFLDEIGTVSSTMQIKLLQVLQEKSFQRVGGEVTIDADVRIITATNSDLKSMCEQGTFRLDLFYRLNVFPIEIPPLRERIDDIPTLVEFFLQRLNKFSTKRIDKVHPAVFHALQTYNWPGNIRELQNLIERAYILETTSMLSPNSFPSELFHGKDMTPFIINTSLTLHQVRQKEVERIERHYLTELLTKNHGRINKTAADAGVGVRQLHKLLSRYRLQKERFKKQEPEIPI
jgi:DNA-binding NtrC family response regulator